MDLQGTGDGPRDEVVDVFISYSHHDKPFVTKLVKALEAEGLTVWWDAHMTPGARIDQEVEGALESARKALAVWSPHSLQSEWVKDEARHAQEQDKLISICLGVHKPPLSFGARMHHDMSGWSGQADERFRPLLSALRGESPARHTNTGPSVRQRRARRRWLIGSLGTLVAASTLGAAWHLDSTRPRGEIVLRDASGKRIEADEGLCSGLQFHFTVDLRKRSHLYMFLQHASGRVDRVYPSEVGGFDNPVRGQLRIPRNPGLNFQLSAEAGTEELLVYTLADQLASAIDVTSFDAQVANGQGRDVLLAVQDAAATQPFSGLKASFGEGQDGVTLTHAPCPNETDR
ncbi:MAG: TIR domain-containing protein [Pseudomonadota bacterium]